MSGKRMYQPVAARFVGNPESGYAPVYTALSEPKESRGYAISAGFDYCACDDFNIAVIKGGRIVSLDWMDEVVDTDPDVLAEVERQTEASR